MRKEKPDLVLYFEISGQHDVGIPDVYGRVEFYDRILRNLDEIEEIKKGLADIYDCPKECFLTKDELKEERKKEEKYWEQRENIKSDIGRD
jgi:hypothetical protein